MRALGQLRQAHPSQLPFPAATPSPNVFPPKGSPFPVPSSSSNHVKLFPFCCSREEGLGGCPAAPQSCSVTGSLPAWAGGREEGENGNLTPAPTNPRGRCASTLGEGRGAKGDGRPRASESPHGSTQQQGG